MPFQLLASQSTLLASTAIYYLLFHFSARYRTSTSSNTIAHLAQLRELLSILHCTLVTILSLLTLHHYSYAMYPPAPPPSVQALSPLKPHKDSDLPLIATRSELLNSLTALETGYLLADSLILYRISSRSPPRSTLPSGRGPSLTHHKDNKDKPSPSSSSSSSSPCPSKTASNPLPLKALNVHHTLFLLALLTLQLYIARARERGVLVIIMFFPMNASSPLGSLRWWLVHHYHPRRPGRGALVALVGWLYLGVYALCRVWLVGWVLSVWGTQQRRFSGGYDGISGGGGGEEKEPAGLRAMVAPVVDVWRVFWALRGWCRLGTGLIWGTNISWLAYGVWRRVGRGLGSGVRGSKVKEDPTTTTRRSGKGLGDGLSERNTNSSCNANTNGGDQKRE